ncbi:MAG: hypothetical protein NXI31_23335 [bacterium]|nr:hypothetical protein [bacterium]
MSRFFCLAGLALGSSCVSYVADAANPAAMATGLRERSGGSFTFEAAVELAYRQNPELRALAAEARANAADRTPFEVLGQLRTNSDYLAVMVDPLALLDLGPRGAANAALAERASVAAVDLVRARWRVAADIAETFAIEAVLASLPKLPDVNVDPTAFESAGLAATVDVARLRAANARLAAEDAAIESARSRNRARFCALVGLPPTAEVLLLVGMFHRAPLREERALLARPDVVLALAKFDRADAEFRAAVAAQYPAIALGPDIPLAGNPLEWMAMLRVPIGAAGRAEASRERREASRARLETALLMAMRELHDEQRNVTAELARAQAARAAANASRSRLDAASAAVAVEVDAFAELARAAEQASRDAVALREAELARRLALHRVDVAYGWPAVVREES